MALGARQCLRCGEAARDEPTARYVVRDPKASVKVAPEEATPPSPAPAGPSKGPTVHGQGHALRVGDQSAHHLPPGCQPPSHRPPSSLPPTPAPPHPAAPEAKVLTATADDHTLHLSSPRS
eukprot:463508-Prymnesium_polylepis.1